jgi:hypothetical protein
MLTENRPWDNHSNKKWKRQYDGKIETIEWGIGGSFPKVLKARKTAKCCRRRTIIANLNWETSGREQS